MLQALEFKKFSVDSAIFKFADLKLYATAKHATRITKVMHILISARTELKGIIAKFINKSNAPAKQMNALAENLPLSTGIPLYKKEKHSKSII